MTELPFRYARVGAELLETLLTKIRGGESAVLLGPRYVGKRLIFERLHHRLQEVGYEPLAFKFLAERPVATVNELRELLAEEVRRVGGPAPSDAWNADDPFTAVDAFAQETGKPPMLLATNVDGMAHPIARAFLQGVRTRVMAGKLIVALSGEDDFHALVHGPKSEFNCANQIVLQGFDEPSFRAFVEHYAETLQITFAQPDEVPRRLYDLTGGNIQLLRVLLWTTIERRDREGTPSKVPITVADIPGSLNAMRLPVFHGADVLWQAIRLIDREPTCWDELAQLIRGEPVRVPHHECAPSLLELAGVAARDGTELAFTSSLMADFCRRYYHARRFGDLYARNGQWEQALERYKLLPPEQRVRPVGGDDRSDATATINALCAAMHLEAGREDAPRAAVQRLFVEGCRLVLGFEEISFWRRDTSNVWKLDLQAPTHGDLTPQMEQYVELVNALPADHHRPPGPLTLREPWGNYALAAQLAAIRSDELGVVVIGDLAHRTVVARQRERLAREVLRHFVQAYNQALAVEGLRLRLSIRDQHVKILNSIFAALGSGVLDVYQTLERAALGLRDLGYRRVQFCLVDPASQRIQGVLDLSDDTSIDVAEKTDWPLHPADKDLQPYVIHTGLSKIVPDASREPLANPCIVRQARMKALAIVPIIDSTGQAIGTIHVERADGLVPAPEEVADLEEFGRQLAVAITQSERVNMLQGSLDEIPEPILIADRLERIRYANRRAADLFQTKPGWRDLPNESLVNAKFGGSILVNARSALNDGHRTVRHGQNLGHEGTYRGAVLTKRILDWREKTVGVFVHVEDLNYQYTMLDAIRLVAEARDTQTAMRSVLEALKLLGHGWARLYTYDAEARRLVGTAAFGYKNPAAEKTFVNGWPIPRDNNAPGAYSWECIEANESLVMMWNSGLPHGERRQTEYGLETRNVQTPHHPEILEKQEGELWIDIPLIALGSILGKISAQCPADVRPDEFEFLKVFSKITAQLLGAFKQRDLYFSERETRLRSDVEWAMASVAHNLGTRVAALDVSLTRYRRRERDLPSLVGLNDDFEAVNKHVVGTIRRVKEMLSEVVPKPAEFDLRKAACQVLSELLEDGQFTFDGDGSGDQFVVHADQFLFEGALIELIQNSRQHIHDPKSLKVRLSVERRDGTEGPQWCLSYKDNGPGIDYANKKRVFERFFSERPGSRPGTGLGLDFVRRVVQAHGGQICEQGKPNCGVEFVVEVPVGLSQICGGESKGGPA